MLPAYVASLTACPPSCAQEHNDEERHKAPNEHICVLNQDCGAAKLENGDNASMEEMMARRHQRWVMAIIILTFCLFLALIIGVRAYATATERA
ncbi:hypothetical protein MCOR25_001536 [Pyricularia grisea]|uniref:Transmembrane protein n=1 Tax=Pyricularia grisea TaxID=148305 RepID=A0A6P8BFH9_PYRGI|nr:uncharacterized protein PgNI_01148 [Pyricularia grisea]KAI6380599.1 hypothetical protein MCOR25_001536 [Pyricularia grisea]TLD15407.1 hypothetical protein PgNI_01148 [Pyricularia grisea]